jgi:hypothetical protein
VEDLDAAERLADRARLESEGVRHHVRVGTSTARSTPGSSPPRCPS